MLYENFPLQGVTKFGAQGTYYLEGVKRVTNDKDTEIKSRYEDYTVEQLKEAYQTIFLYTSEYSDADLAEMDEILAVLKKKNPVPRKYSTEESWELFQETYSEELSRLGVPGTEEVIQENPPADVDKVRTISDVKTPRPVRSRKLLRVSIAVAAVAVFLVAAAATASAMGCNLFGWIPKWNNDVLSFGEDESTKPNDLHDSSQIPAALEQLGIDEPLYPTWLPDGFKREYFTIEMDPVFLHEGYSDGERYLTITIQPSSLASIIIFEKDATPIAEYEKNNTVHYIFADDNQITVSWHTGNYVVYITGNVSIEETEKIIDSVYEVKS